MGKKAEQEQRREEEMGEERRFCRLKHKGWGREEKGGEVEGEEGGVERERTGGYARSVL